MQSHSAYPKSPSTILPMSMNSSAPRRGDSQASFSKAMSSERLPTEPFFEDKANLSASPDAFVPTLKRNRGTDTAFSTSQLGPRGVDERAGDHGSDDEDDTKDHDGLSSLKTESACDVASRRTHSSPQPPRKRPHLDSDAVGRFASMSLAAPPPTSSYPPRPQTVHEQSTSSLSALGSDRLSPLPPAPAPPASPVAAESAAMSVGPASWEIDRYRTFIGNLDDDEDEKGDVHHRAAEGNSASAPALAMTKEDVLSLEQAQDAKRPDAMQDDTASNWEVNDKLLAKVEAHTRAAFIRGDLTRRGPPDDGKDGHGSDQGALVLWRKPDSFLQPAKEESQQTNDTATGSIASQPFAFGENSPQTTFSPLFSNPASAASKGAVQDDGMELDS